MGSLSLMVLVIVTEIYSFKILDLPENGTILPAIEALILYLYRYCYRVYSGA